MLAKHDEDQTRLLTLALSALRTAESQQLKESDRPVLLLRLTEVLRRLSRFEDARIQLEKLRALKSTLPSYLAPVPAIEAELLEERLPFPRPMFPPGKGEISARPITGSASVFGLPINMKAIIANQPATWKYPIEMRYAGIAGETQVSLAVSSAGEVTQARFLRTSQSEFSHAAVEFARALHFAPMETPNGPVAFECTVTVLFTLKEE